MNVHTSAAAAASSNIVEIQEAGQKYWGTEKANVK